MRVRFSTILLVVFALWVARPPEAHAWNPIDAAERGVSGKVRGGVSSLAEAASVPVARNLEASGKKLLEDAEGAIARRLDQAESVTTRLIGETNRTVAENVERIDRSLEARIVQAKITIDDTIDHAADRVDRTVDRMVGRIDAAARNRIDQLGKVAGATITRAEASAREVLRQADAVLGKRIVEVNALVHAAITEADQAAEARIAQLDEVAAKRLGNVDVIATKQSLALEATVLRVTSLVGLVAFLAFALWRLFVEVSNAWAAAPDKARRARVTRTARHGGRRFLIQIALAGVGAFFLWVLSDQLPKGARARAALQVKDHTDALVAAADAFDFPAVRYELAQLEVLRPDDLKTARTVAR